MRGDTGGREGEKSARAALSVSMELWNDISSAVIGQSASARVHVNTCGLDLCNSRSLTRAVRYAEISPLI